MNKKSLLGLLMTGALGAVGCNNGQQNGNNTAGNVTNVTNSTNVTNVTNVNADKGALPALVKLEPANLDGGDYGLLATFAGNVADLDKRLDGSSFTMSHTGDEYVDVSASLAALSEDDVTSWLFSELSGRVPSRSDSDQIIGHALYNFSYSLMGGFNVSDQTVLLLDNPAVSPVSLYDVGIDDYYQTVPGVLRNNGVYSFTLNGNFSCDDFSQLFGSYLFSDLYTAGIMAQPINSDLTDICLADLKDRLQNWLDESLGKGVATISGVVTAAYNANGTTAVTFTLNRSISLADDEKISLSDFSAAEGDFFLNYIKVVVGDIVVGAKKIVLPANTVKDIDGRPNREETIYLLESSLFNTFAAVFGGDSDDEESGFVLELNENDDGMLSKGETFHIIIPSELVHPASASIILIKLFRDAGLMVDSQGSNSSDLSFVALKDTQLPLSVNIPGGLFYNAMGQQIPAQTLVFNDVTAPYVVADDNGNTLQVEILSSHAGSRGQKLLAGDRITIEFSEAIDIEKLKTNYDFKNEMKKASGLGDDCFDIFYNDNKKELYYELKCELDLAGKESLAFTSISAEYVVDGIDGTQEITKIPMAQDAVLSAKVADIFAGQKKEFSYSNSDQKDSSGFSAGDYVEWYVPVLYTADGQQATKKQVIDSISAIKGAKLSVGTLEDLKKNISFIDNKYKLLIPATGLEIVIDSESAEKYVESKMQLVFGEGVYDQYGLSMAGSSLAVDLSLSVQNCVEHDFNINAYYSKVPGEDSCGRLLRGSRVILEFSAEDYDAVLMLSNSEVFFSEIGKNIAKYMAKNTTTGVGENIKVTYDPDSELPADGVLPTGGYLIAYNIEYDEMPRDAEDDYATTLTKAGILNFKYGTAYNVNISMPTTAVEYKLSTLSGDLHDGLLMPGDLVQASVNCNDEEGFYTLTTLITDGAMVLQGLVETKLMINTTILFEYVGDTKDISQGWEIALDGSTEHVVLKEDLPAAPISFKYLKGSAEGNQAIFQTTSPVDGSYVLDEVFGLDAQGADISFLDGGHAHSLYDITDEPFYKRLWQYILDID